MNPKDTARLLAHAKYLKCTEAEAAEILAALTHRETYYLLLRWTGIIEWDTKRRFANIGQDELRKYVEIAKEYCGKDEHGGLRNPGLGFERREYPRKAFQPDPVGFVRALVRGIQENGKKIKILPAVKESTK